MGGMHIRMKIFMCVLFGLFKNDRLTMKDIWGKLKELYDANPTLFGILLFIDLTILYFIIQWIIS